jgi:CubicO group peptidase (beta-lactamase class C family)
MGPSLAALGAKLGGLIPGLLRQHGVPGLAVAVAHRGDVVWSGGYGLADRATGRPVTADTLFNVGSVSKVATAWAVLTLVEHRRVDLDAPVDRYLRRWHLPDSGFDRGAVTTRRVLGHTAGLSVRGYHGVSRPSDRLPALVESLGGYEGSDGPLRVIARPGSSYRYSSGGFTLLQLLVEDVSGTPFADFVRSRVFEPLGMSHSTYAFRPEATATPYGADGRAWPHYQFAEKGSGGLYTTAGDLARLVAAAMPGPRVEPAGRGVLGPEGVRLLVTPAAESQEVHSLGYQILPRPGLPPLLTFRGSNEGWRALVLALADRGDGLVILANSDLGPRVMGDVVCAWSSWAGIELPGLCDGETPIPGKPGTPSR